jgi:bifunctional non-homologous end joining protein LigD
MRLSFVDPMLATLVAEPFSDDKWIFESKLDGVRCEAIRDSSGLQLLSRNRLDLNRRYPELVTPLEQQAAKNYIADGEVVAFKNGVTSFAELQRAQRGGVPVFYYIFDLLHLNGRDLRSLPLIERKEILKGAFDFHGPIRFVEHRRRDGEALYKDACRKGLEGLIAKRADSKYQSGRSRDWLKFKCSAEQEFVIVGYTDSKGERVGFGALLLGYYDGGSLVYAGKVGTGFDTQTLRTLGRELSALQIDRPPVAGEVKERGVHWVAPKLLAQVAFMEWTRDGRLRHPRFLGIRRDKAPRQVVRERAG